MAPGVSAVAYVDADVAAPQGAPLFSRLGADRTGLDFQIVWDKPAEFDRVFYSQNSGGGVTLGDYDGDGLSDVYLTRPSRGNRLFRNLGDLRFADATQAAGLEDPSFWGTGASFVDVDDDGDLDLFACGYMRKNRLYLNDGAGRFTEHAEHCGLDFFGASVMAAFADYDADGDLDLYLVTSGLPPGPRQQFRVDFVDGRPVIPDDLQEYWKLLYFEGDRAKQVEAGQFDRLYRNLGNDESGRPRFVDETRKAGIEGADIGQTAVWWDYNGDSLPDLYVANDYWGPDLLYRNRGDGTFEEIGAEALPHTPMSSMGADFADVDGDGRLDLLATDMAGTNHFKQKLGMGNMSDSGWFLEYGAPRQYMRNALFVNTGTNRFQEAAFLAGVANSDWTWTPRFDDFDDDGWVDLLITNGASREFTNSDLNAEAVRFAPEGSPEFFQFWMRQDYRKDRNLAFRNRGELQFEDVSRSWGFDREGVSFAAATADFDGDGDLDVVVNNMDDAAMVYRNDAAEGGASLRVRLQGTESNRQGIGATVMVVADGRRQSRYVGLARGWMSTSELTAHFGLGEAEQVDLLEVRWPSGVVQRVGPLEPNQLVVVVETPGDESPRPDGAEQEPWYESYALLPDSDRAAAAHRETAHDDFATQPLLPNKLSQLGPGVACGDVNGDARPDFYIGGAAGQPGRLILSDGASGYRSATPPALLADAACEDLGTLFFDADGDSATDLLVISGGVESPEADPAYGDRLYLGDGSGGLHRAAREAWPDDRFSGSVAAAADFDRDGDLDVFVGGRVVPGKYPLSPGSALYRNDGGTFVNATAEAAPALADAGMTTSAIWSDADGDGWIDLLITQEWGPVVLLENERGRLVEVGEQAGFAEAPGWWNSIAAGDVDGDGDLDYAVGGFGWNTKYHADADHPTELYYGSMAEGDKPQIIEAEYEAGKLFPVRGKSCSTNAMPFLAERFTSFEDFALAELPDIYGSQCLERARRFTAVSLASGVWLNDGAGRFTFRAWPRVAQIAPAFGVSLTDVDGDGMLDVYCVQNFFAPQRETGRFDGGVSQLLLGNGDGEFAAVPTRLSGLMIPGDATSLCLTDLNGDLAPDFVAAQNDGPIVAFAHRPPTGKSAAAIRLLGNKGNPSAVGARIEVRFADGSLHAREIAAGGGYLSQSSPDATFWVNDLHRLAEEIQRIAIRWPDGSTTEHQPSELPISEESPGLIVIRQPPDAAPLETL